MRHDRAPSSGKDDGSSEVAAHREAFTKSTGRGDKKLPAPTIADGSLSGGGSETTQARVIG